MPAKKSLGRGLGAIVSLLPVRDGGSARIDEAIRASPGPSVLALSGASFEEMATAADRRAQPAPAQPCPAPVAVAAAPAAVVSDFIAQAEAPAVQYSLFDPQIEHDCVSESVPDEPPAPPVPLARAEPGPPPRAAAPESADGGLDDSLDDGSFLDEQIGGIVLPDVELE